MEKKATSGIMLTLLLTSMLTLAFNIQPVRAEPKTWTVDDDGPADFNTIQEAINAANTGDTVLVHSGTYYENVFVNKTISLLGENKETTIIDGRGGNVVALNASNVSIIAFTLRNGHTGVDGGLWKSDNNTIEDNIITSCWTRGIFFGRYSNGNNVSGNIISNNGFSGIHLEESHSNTISGNTITNHSYANILFYPSSHNTIRTNTIQFSEGYGIASMSYSDYNVIVGNTITDNSIGVYLNQAFGDSVFHNNFINNGNQAYNYGSANTWDDGYPSGGNYWSDYTTRYPGAQELDDSGIWDTPYVIDEDNRDNYPLMNPWTPTPPVITATVDIDPDTLNLKSKGQWITAYIQLPEDYDPEDIDASTVLLNGTIAPVLDPKYDFVTNSSEYLVDHNNDEILERMVKFDRAAVESFIFDHISLREAVKAGFTTVTLTVTGELSDGTPFQGSDTIKIICTVPQKL